MCTPQLDMHLLSEARCCSNAIYVCSADSSIRTQLARPRLNLPAQRPHVTIYVPARSIRHPQLTRPSTRIPGASIHSPPLSTHQHAIPIRFARPLSSALKPYLHLELNPTHLFTLTTRSPRPTCPLIRLTVQFNMHACPITLLSLTHVLLVRP
jgi:hypothetical protein